MIRTSNNVREFVHHALDRLWTRVVVRVGPLAHLEEHIGILCSAAQYWVIGRESPPGMFEDAVHIDERAHIFFREHFDLVHLMRRAEAVEEVQEWDARLERSGVSDESHVHGLLHGIGGKQGEAWGARGMD